MIQTLGTEKARPAIAPQVKIRCLPSETILKEPFVQFCLWRVTCLHMIFCIEAFIMTLTCVESDAFQHMNRQVMSDNGCRQISQIEVLLDKLSDTDFKFYV